MADAIFRATILYGGPTQNLQPLMECWAASHALPESTRRTWIISTTRPLDRGKPDFYKFAGHEHNATLLALDVDLNGVSRPADGRIWEQRENLGSRTFGKSQARLDVLGVWIYLSLTRRCSRVSLLGQLSGQQVHEFESFWHGLTANPVENAVIDLTQVTVIDQNGRNFLKHIERSGVRVLGNRQLLQAEIDSRIAV